MRSDITKSFEAAWLGFCFSAGERQDDDGGAADVGAGEGRERGPHLRVLVEVRLPRPRRPHHPQAQLYFQKQHTNTRKCLHGISRGKFTVVAITADDYLPMRSTEVQKSDIVK